MKRQSRAWWKQRVGKQVRWSRPALNPCGRASIFAHAEIGKVKDVFGGNIYFSRMDEPKWFEDIEAEDEGGAE